jgi:hypothetical protein
MVVSLTNLHALLKQAKTHPSPAATVSGDTNTAPPRDTSLPMTPSHAAEPSPPAGADDNERDDILWEVMEFEDKVWQVMQAGGCVAGVKPVKGFTRQKVILALQMHAGNADVAYEYLSFDP